MKKTNFDKYLEKNLKNEEFAKRFSEASEAWNLSLQLADFRKQAGLSQKELAELLHTSQQQISRMESPSYEGHSLRQLRKVAGALHARVRVILEPLPEIHSNSLPPVKTQKNSKTLQSTA